MNKIAKIVIAIWLLVICLPTLAYSQTAALLPNGQQQFFDNNGNPLSSGTVDFYIAGTSTRKTTWRDSAETIPNTNPVVLDAAGRAIIYGQGTYRQVLKKSNGDLVWDALTASTGAGGSGASTGDGDLVGTVKPWAGLTAPNQYAFAYGQEVNRITFATLYTAITLATTVSCTSASNTLSGIASTEQIRIGSAIEVICLAPGSVVISKTTTSVVVSNPANISINASATFFPWGNGNGSTTFNLPDLRGRVIAGRDNMGGTAASVLTTTYYGANPDALGVTGGNESLIVAKINLPGYILSLGTGSVKYNQISVQSGSGATVVTNIDNTGSIVSNVGSVLNVQIGSGGSDTPISQIQPTLLLNYIIKTTPDTNSAIATGVTSLGNMTGDIACGVGLLCTGNIISATAFTNAPTNTVLANATNATATMAPFSMPSCSAATNALIWTTNTGFGCNTLGTVTSGTLGQLAWYSATGTSVAGNANTNITAGLLSLGQNTSVIGQVKLFGNTSGSLTITPQATAGTPIWTAGTSSGTPAVTASSPLVITTATGNISLPGAAGAVLAGAGPAFTNDVTLGVSGTSAGILRLAGLTSGTGSITSQAAAGSAVILLPTGSGTIAVTATSPIVLNATTGNVTCTTCVTSSGGGSMTGTAPVAVSAAGAISITGLAGGVLAGAGPAFTVTPTLGASGTLGSLTFGNATSGLLTIQPVTGALGTVTVSLPAATDTLVGKATTDTFTNKTFDTAGTGNNFSIASVAVTGNTGTGAVARQTSPGFVTPNIGVATGTSLNGLIITTTTGTLTIANNASASLITSGNFALTLTASAITNSIFPAGTHTLAGLDVAQTWSANQQYNSGNFLLKGSSSGTLTITCAATCGTNTLTLPAGTTDFSATGGTSQVVKQVTAGAALTVGQLAASDLSNGTTGTAGTAVVLATAPTVSGVFNVSGAFKWSTESAPAQITSNQNNYNPGSVICTTTATLIINSDAARDITGLAGGAQGCVLVLINNGGFSITLKENSGSSSAGNKFSFGGDFALASNAGATLRYDGTDSVWRLIGGPPTAGGGSGTVTSVTCGTGLDGGTITTSGTCSLSAARRTLPTTQVFTTGTNATYTTPSNVLYLVIELIGGGGGGGGATANLGTNGSPTCWKTSGTACSTPDSQAGGGNGGNPSNGSPTAGGVTAGTCNIASVIGGGGSGGGSSSADALTGGSGGNSSLGGGAGGGQGGSSGGNGSANTGGGGGGGGGNVSTNSGGGGSSGSTCRLQIDTPAATYVYTVGGGGAGGAAGGAAGGNGGSGRITIREYYGS